MKALLVCLAILLSLLVWYAGATVDVESNPYAYLFPLPRIWERAAAMRVRSLPMLELEGNLDRRVWEDGSWSTPNEVLADLAAYPFHASRIRAADCRHPVIVRRALFGRGFVTVDGDHRIARARLEGRRELPAHTVAFRPGWAGPACTNPDASGYCSVMVDG